KIPKGAVSQLVGTLTHPLNHPKFDSKNLNKINLANCDYLKEFKNDINELTIKVFSNKLFWFFYENVTDPDDSNNKYKKYFLLPIVNKDGQLLCQQKINIPGIPVKIEKNLLITNDISNADNSGLVNEKLKPKKNLISLKIDSTDNVDNKKDGNATATLKDLYSSEKIIDLNYYNYDYNNNILDFIENNDLFSNKLLFIESEKEIVSRPYWFAKPFGLPSFLQNDLGKRYFINLIVDENFKFVRHSFSLNSEFGENPHIVKVFSKSTSKLNNANKANTNNIISDEYYVVFLSAKDIRIASIDSRPGIVEILNLREVDQNFNINNTDSRTIRMNNYYFQRGCMEINFSSFQRSIEVANGLYGIKQFYIVD
ncbi:MAG: hypothetical protein HQK51_07495, partial [Oligoflexia bacterium]|nr:hypothetical protein [Oligoflexia bacterium]